MKKFTGLKQSIFIFSVLLLLFTVICVPAFAEDSAIETDTDCAETIADVNAGGTGTESDTTIEIPPSECSHHYEYTIVKARPESAGYKVGICTDCGDMIKTDYTIAAPDDLSLSSDDFVYTGKTIDPGLKIKDSDGHTVSASNYTAVYSATPKKVGTYQITVTFKKSSTKYAGVMKASFRILPKGTSISKLKSSNNSVKALWKTQTTETSGYQLQFSTSSSFKKGTVNTVTVKSSGTGSKSKKGYPLGKTVYVRIRVYKTVSGKNYYSSWSGKKKIKVSSGCISLNAKACVIMNMDTGGIYYSKNKNQRLANASTTKLMTVLLAMKNKSASSKIKITSTAANTPYSKLGTNAAGDSAYMEDLLYMALLPSDNGVANALAISVSGSISSFVSKMNKEAKALGLKNTHYENAHGLDTPGHYSSAKDLATLAAECMKYKLFRKVVSSKSHTFKTLTYKRTYTVKTTNQLLGDVSGVVGGKTGTTSNAGKCFVCFYSYGGKNFITVVLGAPSDETRWSNTKNLLAYIRKYLA